MKNREEIAQALAAAGYIADSELATAISLMQLLRRPLLLEGEAGVGKTEVAKALASVHATELIRLQCYEGLDQSAALYEWNYQRQLLSIQAHRGDNPDAVRTPQGPSCEPSPPRAPEYRLPRWLFRGQVPAGPPLAGVVVLAARYWH